MSNFWLIEQLKTSGYVGGCGINKLYQIAKQYIADNSLADTVAMRCGDSVVLVTNGKLPQGFKWQAYKGKKNRMRIVKEMELRAQLKRTETRLFLILTSKIGKHTRQGLKRLKTQMRRGGMDDENQPQQI